MSLKFYGVLSFETTSSIPSPTHSLKIFFFSNFTYLHIHLAIPGSFELWCWRRLLRVPWTARRSNQSILKEISPEYSLEGMMLKLKLQYFGHLMQRAYSLEKTLMLGKIEGKRRRGRQRMRWLDGITDSIDMSLGAGSSSKELTLGAALIDSQGSVRGHSSLSHHPSGIY